MGSPVSVTSQTEVSVQAIAELVSELGRHPYAGIVSIGPVGVGKSSNLNTIASVRVNRLHCDGTMT
jgi:putative ribosome biogenesis GTPase RsgA